MQESSVPFLACDECENLYQMDDAMHCCCLLFVVPCLFDVPRCITLFYKKSRSSFCTLLNIYAQTSMGIVIALLLLYHQRCNDMEDKHAHLSKSFVCVCIGICSNVLCNGISNVVLVDLGLFW